MPRDRWGEAAASGNLGIVLHAEALGIRTEIADTAGAAESGLGLAQDHEAEGDVDGALAALDVALGGDLEPGKDGVLPRALPLRAALTREGTGAALALLTEQEARLTHEARMAIRYFLWRATGENDHLHEA